MLRNNRFLFGLLTITLLGSLAACKKSDHISKIVEPPEAARFNVLTNSGNYYIKPTGGTPFVIPMGISTVSDQARTIDITYTSKSAVNGQQYSAPASITIPAGEAVANLSINGLVAGYSAAGKIDTLMLKIASKDTISGKGNYTLIMQKYCDVVTSSLAGAYAKTIEYTAAGAVSWGPYTTTVGTFTTINATSARAGIQNLYDYGGNPVNATFDWTNPAAFRVTIAAQNTGVYVASGGVNYQLWIRTSSTTASTFSSCDGTITLYIDAMAVTDAGVHAGNFSSNYKIVLAK